MKNKVLEYNNVEIKLDSELKITKLSLIVNKGDFVFLIGRTGSGKSSLIKILYGDLTLKRGIGNVLGFDLLKISQKQIPFLRRKIGVVFQDFKLLSDRNIYDNLKFVLQATGWRNKDDIKKRITEVLNEVGLFEIEKKYPFELSGGEQQRTAIARALLNTPELIIADEPTGNLDPQTSNEIMGVFKRLHKQGMAVFMATHDYNMIVKFPGKIFKCDSRKVFEVIAKQNENNKKY